MQSKSLGSGTNSSAATRRVRGLRVAIVACPYSNGSNRVPPLGPMSVLAYVKSVLGDFVKIHLFDFSGCDASDKNAIASIVAWKPSVIGVPVYSSQVEIVDNWVERLRVLLPHTVFVAGGAHPTLTADSFLNRRRYLFDAIVRGDGERPFVAILERVAVGSRCFDIPGVSYVAPDGRVIAMQPAEPIEPEEMANPFSVPITHVNEPLVFSDRRIGRQRKAVAIVSSRSCPLKCSFCAIIAMPGKWRSVPDETLLDWLFVEHARDPYEHIYFLDANFFVLPRRARALSAAIHERLPNVTWSASSTVGMLLKLERDLPTLVSQGLRMVEMGIEAASEDQLTFLNKQSCVATNRRAVRALQRNRIDIGIDFIMFNPDQTLADLEANVAFFRNCDLTQQENQDHLFNSLILYPGTPLRRLYEERVGHAFDPDLIPDIEALFRDPQVKAVYRAFTGPFRSRYLNRIENVRGIVNFAAHRLAETEPERAQRLRLEAIRIQHVPLKVLQLLCRAEAGLPLETAIPLLANWSGYEQRVFALCNDESAMSKYSTRIVNTALEAGRR